MTRSPVIVGLLRSRRPASWSSSSRLDEKGRELVAGKRRDATKLGFAVQWGTVRMLGSFLVDDPVAVPASTVVFVAASEQQPAPERVVPDQHHKPRPDPGLAALGQLACAVDMPTTTPSRRR
ncbi:DUF4158 domain-containing protein [Streptomyces sp. NPDC056501]|uniref:DUF4158 domain-containing protein n=1 Tax=Streptomyces sp. NPDC056501 TaxID=3345841 RepID=UPI003692FBC5